MVVVVVVVIIVVVVVVIVRVTHLHPDEISIRREGNSTVDTIVYTTLNTVVTLTAARCFPVKVQLPAHQLGSKFLLLLDGQLVALAPPCGKLGIAVG